MHIYAVVINLIIKVYFSSIYIYTTNLLFLHLYGLTSAGTTSVIKLGDHNSRILLSIFSLYKGVGRQPISLLTEFKPIKQGNTLTVTMATKGVVTPIRYGSSKDPLSDMWGEPPAK